MRAPKEQLRLALGSTEPCPFEGRPVVLNVSHWTGRGTSEKMVGKVVRHLTGDLVFYHANDGGQWHRDTRCPAPTDQVLVEFLIGQGIEWIYVYDRKREILYRCPTQAMSGAPIETYDGRVRYYLPEAQWQQREQIKERKSRGERRLVDAIGTVLFVDPYLPDVWALRGSTW